MKKNIAAITLLGLVLAACTTEPPPGGSTDPYADPGTPPPAVISDPTVAVAFSVGAPDSDGIIELNVPGFADVGSAGPAAMSTAGFTVVEDGIVKGITVDRIGGGTRAAADIAFVFDTTGSMGSGLDSVISSITAFATDLDASGLDVRLAAVTFGDAFDTHAGDDRAGTGNDEPPTFDPFARPMLDLTTDIGAFLEFIDEQEPEDGGSGAENAVGALMHAHNALDWRPGAQCVLIVITDIYAWEAPAEGSVIREYYGNITEPWIPPASADAIAQLRGDCVVHVVSPDFASLSDSRYVDMAIFTGADATGGVHYEWNGLAEFDMSELPITGALTSGHVVRYRGSTTGDEHEVRLVYDDGSGSRGEHTTTATY